MINFGTLSKKEFLAEYWQKKPLVIRDALPDFINPITAEELAGLALEEDVESRIVTETPNKKPYWHLKNGPFIEKDFANLPASNWTLLVQGVDRLLPGVMDCWRYFTMIPSWRRDDIMISLATKMGSVGPHYDNYDVFLYQAEGERRWSLTTQQCNPENTIKNIPLRLMEHFNIEQEFILKKGDMLYLPAHVGHYGVALSDNCLTYSFGYRSYDSQELWESLSDFAAETELLTGLYSDPDWNAVNNTNQIPKQAITNAQTLLQKVVDSKNLMEAWFGAFVTRIDEQAERLLPLSLENVTFADFEAEFAKSIFLSRESLCRFAYFEKEKTLALFVNGYAWPCEQVNSQLIKLIADHTTIELDKLKNYVKSSEDWQILFQMWQLQWLFFK